MPATNPPPRLQIVLDAIAAAETEGSAIRRQHGNNELTEPARLHMNALRRITQQRRSAGDYALHAALQGALTAIVCNISAVYMAQTPQEEANAWGRLLTGVAAGIGTGVGCAGLKAAYDALLVDLKPHIISICRKTKLTELARQFAVSHLFALRSKYSVEVPYPCLQLPTTEPSPRPCARSS